MIMVECGAAVQEVAVHSTTAAAGVAEDTYWIVHSGACTTVGTKIISCIQSPYYPSAYSNQHSCVFEASFDGPINVVAFNTESGYDVLTVNGYEYDGTSGPAGVVPTTTIYWTADSSEAQSGWKLCFGPELYWIVHSGECMTLGDCIHSPNYPSNYGTGQRCEFEANFPGAIDVVAFDTNTYYDALYVDGHAYSGGSMEDGPVGVAPYNPIVWSSSSDALLGRSGWKLCPGGAAGEFEDSVVHSAGLHHIVALTAVLSLIVALMA